MGEHSTIGHADGVDAGPVVGDTAGEVVDHGGRKNDIVRVVGVVSQSGIEAAEHAPALALRHGQNEPEAVGCRL